MPSLTKKLWTKIQNNIRAHTQKGCFQQVEIFCWNENAAQNKNSAKRDKSIAAKDKKQNLPFLRQVLHSVQI